MVNFCLLTAEICWWVWGTPANFNGFHVLAALLSSSGRQPNCGVEQRAPPTLCSAGRPSRWPSFLVTNHFLSYFVHPNITRYKFSSSVSFRPFLGDCLQNSSPYAIGLLSRLSVYDAGVLWPNGSMDEYETWDASRRQSWPHSVRWGPSSPPLTGQGLHGGSFGR